MYRIVPQLKHLIEYTTTIHVTILRKKSIQGTYCKNKVQQWKEKLTPIGDITNKLLVFFSSKDRRSWYIFFFSNLFRCLNNLIIHGRDINKADTYSWNGKQPRRNSKLSHLRSHNPYLQSTSADQERYRENRERSNSSVW